MLQACWCHLGDLSEALLCILLTDSLTIYNISGKKTEMFFLVIMQYDIFFQRTFYFFLK